MGVPLTKEKSEERFWSQVDKGDGTGCWVWTGYVHKKSGYGLLDRKPNGKRKVVRVHRFAWELLVGPIPEGLQALHGCDNRLCVRPDPKHVHLGTHAVNMAEMAVRNRAAREWRKPNTKIGDEVALEIRASKERGVDLARRHGISQQSVCCIRKGRSRVKAVPKVGVALVRSDAEAPC